MKQLGSDRGEWVASAVEKPVHSVLDIGCSYGWTLARLSNTARKLVGVDMDESALDRAKADYPHICFIQQDGATLPFESETFDVVILSEVIEHVGDENKTAVIQEAHRVLKNDGQFLFTAPYQGLFAWADPMDFKRRFSSIYRLYMRLTSYTPKTPIEIGHKHVSFAEITSLFAGRFRIERVIYCGLFMPFLSWVLAIDSRIAILPQRWHAALNRFRAWESGIPCGYLLAFNIRIKARKLGRSE